MKTFSFAEIIAMFEKADPQVREGLARMVSAVLGGGGLEAAVKEAEITIALVAALKVEDSLPGAIGRI